MKKPHKQSPPTQGNRKNIPPEAHRRSSVLARALMNIPAKSVK